MPKQKNQTDKTTTKPKNTQFTSIFDESFEDYGDLDSETDEQREERLSKRKAIREMQFQSIQAFRNDMSSLLKASNEPQQTNQKFRADTKILVGGQIFQAHKLILYARSAYFRTKLQQLPVQNDVLEIDLDGWLQPFKIEPSIFQILLDYLYSGQLALTAEKVFEIFEAASVLQLTHAEQLCSLFLKMSTDAKSILTLLLAALKRNDEKFITICVKAMESNTKEILQNDVFLQLPRSAVLNLLQDEEINCTEIELFQAVLKWHQTNEKSDNSQEKLDELLQYIRFPLMTTEELLMIDKLKVVKEDLLLEAYRWIACDNYYEDRSQLPVHLYSFRIVPRKGQHEQLLWRLDEKCKNSKLTISGSQKLTVSHDTTSGHASVLGTIGFKKGVHKWKVKIEGTSAHWIGIGVMEKHLVTSDLTTDYNQYYGCSSANQLYKATGPLANWAVGNELVCTLDMDKCNFKIQGPNTDVSASFAAGLTLYPVFNLYATGNQITISR